MLHPTHIALVVAIIGISEAFIEFEKSRLYDEQDFEGNETILLGDYCALGCQMYVSIPKDSTEIAKGLYIESFDGAQTSLKQTISKKTNNGMMTPHLIPKGSTQLKFINKNVELNSAPVAVWILRADAAYIEKAKVYNGADAAIVNHDNVGIITLFSAEAFNTHSGPLWGAQSLQAITAGFDAFGSSGKCSRVFKTGKGAETSGKYMEFDVRSPLLTIAFKSTSIGIPSTLILTSAKSHQDGTFYLDQPTFAASPGYVGCAVKEGSGRTKTFRSSLHAGINTEFHSFANDYPVSVAIYADLHLDSEHAVDVVADGESKKWAVNTTLPKKLVAKELRISWDGTEEDEYFMIRITPVAGDDSDEE